MRSVRIPLKKAGPLILNLFRFVVGLVFFYTALQVMTSHLRNDDDQGWLPPLRDAPYHYESISVADWHPPPKE